MRDLQIYLNHVHSTWKYLYFGGVNGPHLLGTLVVDGIFGWRTFQALINYIAYSGKYNQSIFITEVAWWFAGVLVSGDTRQLKVTSLQKFINAALDQTNLYLSNDRRGYVPYLRAR